MKKELTTKRRMSAIVAMALAVIVTFTAGLNTYGDSKIDPKLSMEIKAAETAAYLSVVEDELFDLTTDETQIIKIYNADYELVQEVVLSEDEVIEDKEVQKLINRAEYLSSFSKTSVYKLLN